MYLSPSSSKWRHTFLLILVSISRRIEAYHLDEYDILEINEAPDADLGLEGTMLDLSAQNITVIEAADLIHFVSVESIDLNENKLTVIKKDSFAKNIALTIVMLSRNRLQTIEKGSFANLLHLKYLDLSYNHLEYLDPDLFQNNKNLSKLWLNNNKLTYILEESLNHLEGLQQLFLHNNFLNRFPMEDLNEKKTLEILFLSNNGIHKLDYKEIQVKFPNLKSFSINGNFLNCTFTKKLVHLLLDLGIEIESYDERRDEADHEYKGISCADEVSYNLLNLQLHLQERIYVANNLAALIKQTNEEIDRLKCENAHIEDYISKFPGMNKTMATALPEELEMEELVNEN